MIDIYPTDILQMDYFNVLPRDMLQYLFLRIFPEDITKLTILCHKFRGLLHGESFKRAYFQRWRGIYDFPYSHNVMYGTCSTLIVRATQRAAIQGRLAEYRYLTSILGMWFDPNYHRTVVFASPKVLEYLLQDSKIDIHKSEDEAFQEAVKSGKVEIVKLFLQDGRIDPSDNCNFAIRSAVLLDHPEVVKVLLEDSRVDPRVTRLDSGVCVKDELIHRTKNTSIRAMLLEWYAKRCMK